MNFFFINYPLPVGMPASAHFQFERHGYFVTDRMDHAGGKLVFNRVMGLNDSWGK